MNDVAVREIWLRLKQIELELTRAFEAIARIDAQVRARLKEEAEEREMVYHAPRLHPFYSGKRPKV